MSRGCTVKKILVLEMNDVQRLHCQKILVLEMKDVQRLHCQKYTLLILQLAYWVI